MLLGQMEVHDLAGSLVASSPCDSPPTQLHDASVSADPHDTSSSFSTVPAHRSRMASSVSIASISSIAEGSTGHNSQLGAPTDQFEAPSKAWTRHMASNRRSSLTLLRAPTSESLQKMRRSARSAGNVTYRSLLAQGELVCVQARRLPMLEPLSRARLSWEGVVAVASAATLSLQPLAWAFPALWPPLANVVGCVCTPIFAFHILVVLRTAVPQHGMLNRDAKTAAVKYRPSEARSFRPSDLAPPPPSLPLSGLTDHSFHVQRPCRPFHPLPLPAALKVVPCFPRVRVCVRARRYLFSTRFLTDLIVALAYPLQYYTSAHLAPLYLVSLRHLLFGLNMCERALKTSHGTRRIFTLCLLSTIQVRARRARAPAHPHAPPRTSLAHSPAHPRAHCPAHSPVDSRATRIVRVSRTLARVPSSSSLAPGIRLGARLLRHLAHLDCSPGLLTWTAHLGCSLGFSLGLLTGFLTGAAHWVSHWGCSLGFSLGLSGHPPRGRSHRLHVAAHVGPLDGMHLVFARRSQPRDPRLASGPQRELAGGGSTA